jgi:hypothetical protein
MGALVLAFEVKFPRRPCRKADQTGHILDLTMPYVRLACVSEARKITANLPRDALARAQRLTGKGVTATLVEALAALDRQEKRTALRRLRGKISFDLDLERTRR